MGSIDAYGVRNWLNSQFFNDSLPGVQILNVSWHLPPRSTQCTKLDDLASIRYSHVERTFCQHWGWLGTVDTPTHWISVDWLTISWVIEIVAWLLLIRSVNTKGLMIKLTKWTEYYLTKPIDWLTFRPQNWLKAISNAMNDELNRWNNKRRWIINWIVELMKKNGRLKAEWWLVGLVLVIRHAVGETETTHAHYCIQLPSAAWETCFSPQTPKHDEHVAR